MKYGCDALYLDSECPTSLCGPTTPNCSQSNPSPRIRLQCPDPCELEAMANCARMDPLLSQWFDCADPIAALSSAWNLISCLPWCNQCVDPSRLLILAAAHLVALGQLQKATTTAQLNAAMKGAINQAIISDPNHWNLTIPGKLFLQQRPKAIGVAGAAIY